MSNDSNVAAACAEARALRWQSMQLDQQNAIAAAQLRQSVAERRTLVAKMAVTRKALQDLLQKAPRRRSRPLPSDG